MQLKRFGDVREFYQQVEPFLMAHEAEHCLMLGLCNNLMTTDFYRESPYMAVVEHNGGIVGAALRTPPNNLILSEDLDEAAIAVILEGVSEVYPSLPGVVGPKAASQTFANMWAQKMNTSNRLGIAECIYKLTVVYPVEGVGGEYCPATKDERDLLIKWFIDFEYEALNHKPPREEVERWIDLRLNRDPHLGGIRIWWDDGKPVSFAGYSGSTPNGIRIGPVYTPPEFRGHGYASGCVAALSQEMLDRGRKFCFLFTDLSNPTSNHIYQNIGYEPVSDFDEHRFRDSQA